MNKLVNVKNIDYIKKNNFFLILFLIIVLSNFLIILKNYWTIFLIIGLLIYLIVKKINKYQIIIAFFVITLYVLLIIFVSKKINLNYIINFFEQKTKLFYLREQTIKYFEQIYANKTALSVVKLFIFNIKTEQMNQILINAKELDILYLFTISGMHINLLVLIIKKIFHKHKIICEITEWILILSMTYFLKCSIPTLRILTTKIFKYNFKDKTAISLSGILNSFLFLNIVNNYGFILSYGCTLCIITILELKLKKYLELILMSLICSLFSSFILLVMNNKLNLMGIIYNFCLSPFIMLWYIWIQFTFLVPYLQNIQEYIYNGFYWISTQLGQLNFNIYLHSNIKQIFILFYSPFIWLWLKN